ncbi:uncharacterized protein LOC143037077 [Oratosquilla oratoria]|uniref:uncharacterized protein LOC143037077 n=1 Tax=Oratosquilla oratoria TaxID=337810 RepID=UPI003F76F56B
MYYSSVKLVLENVEVTRLRWYGHTMWLADDRRARNYVEWTLRAIRSGGNVNRGTKPMFVHFQTAVALALVALSAAQPNSRPTYLYSAPDDSHESHESLEVLRLAPELPVVVEEDYGPAKYDFNYAVKDEESYNDFGHQEVRDGDRTDGSYFVHLPDGRLQKVVYYVDGDSGYVAEVTYEGEARYPEPAVKTVPDSIESLESIEGHDSLESQESLESHSDEDDSVESHSDEDDSSEERFVYSAPAPTVNSMYWVV